MHPRDPIHPFTKQALIKEGWKITDAPLEKMSIPEGIHTISP